MSTYPKPAAKTAPGFRYSKATRTLTGPSCGSSLSNMFSGWNDENVLVFTPLYEDRDFRAGEDLARHRPEYGPGYTKGAVGGHEDQVASLFLYCMKDAVYG